MPWRLGVSQLAGRLMSTHTGEWGERGVREVQAGDLSSSGLPDPGAFLGPYARQP